MSYDPKQIANYVDQGTARLLSQFQEKPVFRALVRSYLNRIQELESAIWEVITIRGIDGSSGVGLDAIGNVVGRHRLGLGDADYRVALKCQILINRSSGTPDDMQGITVLSIDPGLPFTYQEAFEATIVITVQGALTFSLPILLDNLTRAKAGGVRLLLITSPQPLSNMFTFSPYAAPIRSTAKGFGDIQNPGTGGFLVNVSG